jgi:hypothetical protein
MNGMRTLAAIIVGNLLGLSAWTLARTMLPWLWRGRGGLSNVPLLMGLVAATAILFAAPPVLAGALGAWLSGRAQLGVGLASGLWSLALLQSVPAGLPVAPGLWYATTVLVLLSGMLGGWMMELRAQGAPKT